ncbi:MAG TPA: hypothetical protein VJT49_17410 [Amycolatopsis sp.]|uniref:hypothetical protein n=1 Tax=Amycolatopsis sp. TaxID=37632 RepID=UPI002B48D254|nr:hypothetical protein [Amycolatopsis sp.]HKS46851.1 hypothetical protein [Amycolatopsis sp.]
MHIDWGALGTVFVVSLVVVVALCGLFAVGVRGLSARVAAREAGVQGTAGLTTAVLCFAVCTAVIGYGVYLIVG